jgi:type II secretory pathway predicted ATPase ExeA
MPSQAPGTKLRQLAERGDRVFASYPLVARYFPAPAVEDARHRLTRAIERGDGPGLVIGAPGSGKSLLLQVVATQFHEKFDVVLLAAARFCSRRALLQAILFELGLPYKVRDEGDLRLSLLDHLLSKDCPAGLLLLVDEAQALPVALLDEVRILTNLVRGGVPRVRLVLAGTAALEEAFAHPELESFSQRLSARCYLPNFNREETSQYIRAQVAASGGAPDEVFSADAAAAVFDAADGVPRLVNQLCDRALQFAVTKGAPSIDRQIIQEAWCDLQQLPTPWETQAPAAALADESQVIEFGNLKDDRITPLVVRHEPMLDDDTELDSDEEIQSLIPPAVTPPAARVPMPATHDPFAEKFDEEEVVLDNFAAWDDMFFRETPRVENRRDPGFSTLVQAAIDASPVAASKFSAAEVVTDAESPQDASVAWPRLRLAVVSDNVSADSYSPVAQSSPPSAIRSETLASVLSAFAISSGTDRTNLDESPIVIVEDDNAKNTPTPPVRREDYRHLFSRLRSG